MKNKYTNFIINSTLILIVIFFIYIISFPSIYLIVTTNKLKKKSSKWSKDNIKRVLLYLLCHICLLSLSFFIFKFLYHNKIAFLLVIIDLILNVFIFYLIMNIQSNLNDTLTNKDLNFIFYLSIYKLIFETVLYLLLIF